MATGGQRSRLTRSRWNTRLRYLRSSGKLRRWTLYGLAALLAAWVAWIVVTGLLARRDANEIRDRLARVEAQIAQGDLAGARATAASIPPLAHRAHYLTTGPAWWTAAELPIVGAPFETTRGATEVADDIGTHGIPALLQVAQELDPSALRSGARSVDLAPLTNAAPRLAVAARTLQDAAATLDATPRSSWLAPVDSLRTSLAEKLHSVVGYVDAGARVARILPEILGRDGPRRYFVGLQNEAELRGTGGLPGAFAIAVADHGTVRFTHFESDNALLPPATRGEIDTGLDFGREYQAGYGASGPTTLFQNSNLSPHFPYAAQIWAAMWEKHSGERIDGAIALDPQVLANFLAVTGPVRTPQGVELSADNVVPITESQQYALFATDNAARKQFLVDALHVVADKILDGTASPTNIVRAMSASAKQHRVLVWTRDAEVQASVDQTDYAGTIPAGSAPFVGLVLNNLVGGKLDYYLHRSLDYQRIGCGAQRDMVVTITLRNAAPVAGLPPLVTGRLDRPRYDTAAGDNRTLLDYFATAGTQLTSVRIDGSPATSAVRHERGHPVYRIDLELPRGKARTVVLHLAEPAGSGPLRVWRQPGVTAVDVRGVEQSCS